MSNPSHDNTEPTSGQSTPNTNSANHTPTPRWQENLAAGKPAIVPTRIETDPKTSVITKADVLEYATAHPVPSINPVVPTKIMVSHVPAKVLGWETALPRDLLVYAVSFTGAFGAPEINGNVYPPDYSTPYGATVPGSTIFSHAWQVYDAHTGNLLIQYIMPRSGDKEHNPKIKPVVQPFKENAAPDLKIKPVVQPFKENAAPDEIAIRREDVEALYNGCEIDFIKRGDIEVKYGISGRGPADTIVCLVVHKGKIAWDFVQPFGDNIPKLKYGTLAFKFINAQTGIDEEYVVPTERLYGTYYENGYYDPEWKDPAEENKPTS